MGCRGMRKKKKGRSGERRKIDRGGKGQARGKVMTRERREGENGKGKEGEKEKGDEKDRETP